MKTKTLFLAIIFILSSKSFGQTFIPNWIEFSHFVPQRYGEIFEDYSWWNGNYVSTEVHALSDPFRYKMMPAVWKETHEMYDPITKWWFRTPHIAKIGATVAIDVGFRTYDAYKIECQYDSGEIDEAQRETEHVKNIGGFIFGWIEGTIGSTGGCAAGSSISPGPGTIVGIVIGGSVGYYHGDKDGQEMSEFMMKKFIGKYGTVAEIKDKTMVAIGQTANKAIQSITETSTNACKCTKIAITATWSYWTE